MKMVKTVVLCLCVVLLTGSLSYAGIITSNKESVAMQNMQIILENGNTYDMTSSDRKKWNAFIRKTSATRLVYIIAVTIKPGSPRTIRVSIAIMGETEGRVVKSNFKENSEIIDKTILAVNEMLNLFLQS